MTNSLGPHSYINFLEYTPGKHLVVEDALSTAYTQKSIPVGRLKCLKIILYLTNPIAVSKIPNNSDLKS